MVELFYSMETLKYASSFALWPRWIDLLYCLYEFHFQILLMNEEITSAELDFFLRFPIKPHVTSPVDFLSNTSWGGVCTLSAKEEFRYVVPFYRDVVSNSIIFHKINISCPYETYTRTKCFFISFLPFWCIAIEIWIVTLRLHQNDGRSLSKVIAPKRKSFLKSGKIRRPYSVCVWCAHYGK